jgi:hypothetical protein
MRTAVHSQMKAHTPLHTVSFSNLSLKKYRGAVGQPKETTSLCDMLEGGFDCVEID